MEETFSSPQNTPPPATAQTPSAIHPKRPHLSLVTSLLVIVLTVALIILGEKALFDANRWLNPAHDRYGYAPSGMQELLIPTAYALSIDDSVPRPVAPSRPYSRQSYDTYRLLLHAAVIIPLFLLMFLLYYFFRFKKPNSPYKILSYAYITFAFYMIIRLLAEICYFLIKNLKTGGVYIVLIMLIAIFTALIALVQKRLHAKNDMPTI